MPRSSQRSRARRVHWLAAGAGVALAGGIAAAVAAIAAAGSFTLRVEKNVHVTNDPTKAFRVKAVNTHESVAVGPAGFAVYTFQGETTHHIICHKGGSAAVNCWAFWPPVSVSSAKSISKQKGIKGKLGTFRNHGTRQLTLNGHPLYYFTPDLQAHNKRRATGDELKTFGSIWHIVRAGASSGSGSSGTQSSQPTTTSSTPTSTSTTTTPTTTNPYPYPY